MKDLREYRVLLWTATLLIAAAAAGPRLLIAGWFAFARGLV